MNIYEFCHDSDSPVYVRSAIPDAKWHAILNVRCICVITGLDLLTEVLMHGAGVVLHFELSKTRHTQQLVLVEDVAKFFLRYVPIVVPGLPVESVHQRALRELEAVPCSISMRNTHTLIAQVLLTKI